ncbi:hypothetical protein Hanom_Chr04g00296161 [Helianthus anomalus]
MLEEKKIIGLAWEPKLPSLLLGKNSGSNNKSQNVPCTSLIQSLLTGCSFHLTTPRRLTSYSRSKSKTQPERIGTFDMPAPTLTPELKKDLKLLKVMWLFLILEHIF